MTAAGLGCVLFHLGWKIKQVCFTGAYLPHFNACSRVFSFLQPVLQLPSSADVSQGYEAISSARSGFYASWFPSFLTVRSVWVR